MPQRNTYEYRPAYGDTDSSGVRELTEESIATLVEEFRDGAGAPGVYLDSFQPASCGSGHISDIFTLTSIQQDSTFKSGYKGKATSRCGTQSDWLDLSWFIPISARPFVNPASEFTTVTVEVPTPLVRWVAQRPEYGTIETVLQEYLVAKQVAIIAWKEGLFE